MSESELVAPWEVPTSWAWQRMGDVCAVIGGATPDTSDPRNFDGGDIPWVTPADLSGYREKFISRGQRNITKIGLESSSARLLPKGTVLFSSRAPVGYVAIAEMPLATNQGFKSFVPPAGITSDYLYYYLQRAKPLALELASGTTFQEVSGKRAAQIPLAIAPTQEQSRIVSKLEELLSDLDAGVAALERARRNLKRYRAAVLKAAVEGKLTEPWRKAHPDVEPASKLLERILAERRRKWEVAQLAKFAATSKSPPKGWKERYPEPAKPDAPSISRLPEGWWWATTDQLFWYVTSGSRGWAAHYSDTGPLFLRIANLDHYRISLDLSKLQYVTPPPGTEGERTRLLTHDLLISITADVGMVAYVERELGEAYINQHIALARGALREVMEYLAWFLTSESGQVQFKSLQRGATKVGLGLDDIRAVLVPLPPLTEQTEIIEQIDAAYSAADKSYDVILQALRRSARLRQAVLKRAFEGKLVPQDSNDEPASALLERICAQRRSHVPRTETKKRSGRQELA